MPFIHPPYTANIPRILVTAQLLKEEPAAVQSVILDKGEQKNLAKIGSCPFKVTSCAWPPPSNSGHGKSPLRDYPFGHSEGESTCRHHTERFLSVPWDVFQELF